MYNTTRMILIMILILIWLVILAWLNEYKVTYNLLLPQILEKSN